jgi:dipeptidyl aminopeptidase/acylaminoacyl peptidase
MGRFLACATVLLAAAGATWADQTPIPMGAVDLLSIPTQGEVRVAPDGRRVLFARSTADWEKDHLVTHIWMATADGGQPVQMTNGADGERSPRWAPDGTRFCFVAKRDEKEAQLWVQAAGGGEALQLSDHETAVSDPEWSPDGARIFFTAEDPLSKEEKEGRKDSGDAINFDRDYRQTHLWSIDTATKKEERVTGGDFSVLAYSLSRDGARIVYRAGPTPLYDDTDESEVYLRDVAGGEPVRLTHNHVPESNAELSPDGSSVLFVADADASFEDYYQGNLFVVPAAGGPAQLLAPDFQGEVMSAAWSKDGKSIVFLGNTGVRSDLYRLDPVGGTVTAVTEGDHTVSRWQLEPTSGALGYEASTPSSPGDVWLAAALGSAPVRLTRYEEEIASSYAMPKVEVVRWKGGDGATVEGILTYPLGYEAGKRYPLVVEAHGGPASSSTLRFASWSTYAPVLAAKGYALLSPNYRGSTGYGDAFLRNMVGHYFDQSDDDVMAGVDAMIARGLADPDKLVIMGWSAGGHMTDWLVTHTDRFAAASSGAGASDWISMYAQSDVRIYRTPWFGGTPWQKDAPLQAYMEASPVFSAWRAKTPTLILVGEKDPRVPMPQSVEMFRALRANGVDTKLIVFPGEPHGPRTLKHRLYKMNVELAWYAKHLFGQQYEMERPPSPAKQEEKTTP